MRGADTLIPARFLTLLGHFCVLVTLLWGSNRSVRHCLPSLYIDSQFQTYHRRFVIGLAASIVLLVIELITFIFGITMFSSTVALTSIAGHGFASIFLTYFILDGWLCDWFWFIFFFCSFIPLVVDITTAFLIFVPHVVELFCYCGINVLLSPGYANSQKTEHYLNNKAMKILQNIYKVFVTNEQQCLTTNSDEYRPGWSVYLVVAAVVTTLGSSLPVGFNIGVVNTPAEIIKNFCYESFVSRYDVPLDKTWLNVLWASVVSMFIVGGCIGSILGSVLADKIGRKKATISASVLFILGGVLFLSCRVANSVEMLIAGRLLVGLAGGLTTTIVPMYLTELAPAQLTGALGVACPLGVNIGVLVGQVMGLESLLGSADDWPYLLSVYVVLVIISLPFLFIIPESPKYLFVIRKNEAAAIDALRVIRGASCVSLSREVVSEGGAGGGEHCGMMQLLRQPALRLPLLLVCASQAGQQTSGINAVFYYSQMIFKQAGLSPLRSQYATVVCGAINVCTALWVSRLQSAGRRPLLLASTGGAALALAALAGSILYIKAYSWMPFVCMSCVFLYVFIFGFGLGPIPYFIASELFCVSPRPAAMSWGSLCNWGGNFLVGMTFPSTREALGPYCFLLFSAITGTLFCFLKMYFPETKDRTPAQISQLCSRGFKSQPVRRSNSDI